MLSQFAGKTVFASATARIHGRVLFPGWDQAAGAGMQGVNVVARYMDPSSGAALSTRDLLELLAAHGWGCAVLSGPELDFEQPTPFESVLRAQDLPFQFRPGAVLDTPCTLYHCALGGVPVHAFVPAASGPRRPPTRAEGQAFLSLVRSSAP